MRLGDVNMSFLRMNSSRREPARLLDLGPLGISPRAASVVADEQHPRARDEVYVMIEEQAAEMVTVSDSARAAPYLPPRVVNEATAATSSAGSTGFRRWS